MFTLSNHLHSYIFVGDTSSTSHTLSPSSHLTHQRLHSRIVCQPPPTLLPFSPVISLIKSIIATLTISNVVSSIGVLDDRIFANQLECTTRPIDYPPIHIYHLLFHLIHLILVTQVLGHNRYFDRSAYSVDITLHRTLVSVIVKRF